MAEITIEADIDSRMENGFPDANRGSHDDIAQGAIYQGGTKDNLYRAIGNFDCSAIAGLTVNSAKLVRQITLINNGGVTARVSRCTRPADWVEGEVTWNDYKASTAWTSGGGDFDDTGPPAKVDYTTPSGSGEHEVTGLKDIVQDALDNRSDIVSIIIRLVAEDPGSDTSETWRSKDYGSDIWRLVIDYTPAAHSVGDRMRHRW